MAKVLACKKPRAWEFDAEQMQLPFGERKQDLAFAAMLKKSDAIDLTKRVSGTVVSFPYALSYAHYKVLKEEPLTLEHIPYHDAWRLQGYNEAALTVEDIKINVSAYRRDRKPLPGGRG